MIRWVRPLPVGNAIHVIVEIPQSTVYWRLLRKLTDDIGSEADPDATLVYEGGGDYTIDQSGLSNGVIYFYRAFYFNGSTWSASDSVSAQPAAEVRDESSDVLDVVRQRLRDGLATQVENGFLRPTSGKIPVLTAPPVFEETDWPVVTVHLDNDAASERFIGDDLTDEDYPGAETVEVARGWLSSWTIRIVGWSRNPDERIRLRKAIKRLIIGNLPVFDSVGMEQVEFRVQDEDDMNSYSAPVYQVVCVLTCLAPSVLAHDVGVISTVNVSGDFDG